MAEITIIFGTDEGSTEEAAERIAEALGGKTRLVDVSEASREDFENATALILGTPTLGDGELQEDWADFESNLDEIDFTGKKVALFGLGDQDGYPETFVDGLGILYRKVVERGAEVVGSWPLGGYDYEASEAEVDGHFVGLVLDEDNQPDLSEERIRAWVESLPPEFQA